MYKRLLKYTFLTLLFLIPALVFAHPLGMSAFGHRMLLQLYRDHIELTYVLEIPTSVLLAETSIYKADHEVEEFDERVSSTFNQEMLSRIERSLVLTIDGKRRGWRRDPTFTDQTGRGDINFFEYRLRLFAHLPETKEGASFDIEVVDENFDTFQAVFLDGVVAQRGVRVDRVNLPDKMEWNKDPSFNKIDVIAQIDNGSDKTTYFGASNAETIQKKEGEGSRLAALIHEKDLSVSFIIVAIMTAFALGAAHALTPGHGKALVGAYLVGSRGDYLHAVILGLVVTISHTAIVFLLGLFFLFFQDRFLPEETTPYIGLASGVIIVFIGMLMLLRWLKTRYGEYRHDHGAQEDAGFRSLLALGISGGMVPCPSALALMLIAISIGRVAWGMVLVSIFSLGLASVLILLGVLAVHATVLFNGMDSGRRFMRFAPLVSALIITGIGIVIVYMGIRAI